jgi:hypothetical protein
MEFLCCQALFSGCARQGHKGAASSSEDEGLVLNQQGYASSSVQAARQFGVSGPTVQRAKRIKEEAPEKVDDIIAGRTTTGASHALSAEHVRNAPVPLLAGRGRIRGPGVAF